MVAQVLGACVGAMVANLMFELPRSTSSTDTRRSGGLWLGEFVATFGLLLVIFGVVRSGARRAARVRRWRLHRRRVLVHVVDQLREPRGHRRPHAQRHLRRHRSVERARVHRHAVRRGARRRRARPLLYPDLPAADLIVPHETDALDHGSQHMPETPTEDHYSHSGVRLSACTTSSARRSPRDDRRTSCSRATPHLPRMPKRWRSSRCSPSASPANASTP